MLCIEFSDDLHKDDFMTITIDLPASVEEKLRAHAAATGKKIETVVVEAVEAKLTLSKISLREILAPIHDDFKKSGMSEQELDHLIQESIAETRAARHSKPDPSA